MSPEEHYAKAEELLEWAAYDEYPERHFQDRDWLTARAQAHATMALFTPAVSVNVRNPKSADEIYRQREEGARLARNPEALRKIKAALNSTTGDTIIPPAEEETKAEDEARTWGINTPEPSDVQYLRDRFGNLFKRFAPDTWRRWRPAAERFGDADWTWVELAINLPTPVLGVPHELAATKPAEKKGEPEAIEALTEAIRFTVEYVGTEMLPPIEGWDWYDALTKYAPDKAKAFLDAYATPDETPGLVTELAKSIMNRAYDSNEAWDRERSDRPRFEHYAKFALSYLASSPVVPAPTETGPWKRIEDVPEGVIVVAANGWKYRKGEPYSLHLARHSNAVCCKAVWDLTGKRGGPFVAAEKEEA